MLYHSSKRALSLFCEFQWNLISFNQIFDKFSWVSTPDSQRDANANSIWPKALPLRWMTFVPPWFFQTTGRGRGWWGNKRKIWWVKNVEAWRKTEVNFWRKHAKILNVQLQKRLTLHRRTAFKYCHVQLIFWLHPWFLPRSVWQGIHISHTSTLELFGELFLLWTTMED